MATFFDRGPDDLADCVVRSNKIADSYCDLTAAFVNTSKRFRINSRLDWNPVQWINVHQNTAMQERCLTMLNLRYLYVMPLILLPIGEGIGFAFKFVLVAPISCRSDTSQSPPATVKNTAFQDNQAIELPTGQQYYLGREIAQTMHYTGASWLIRESREQEERCSMLLANMGLKTGMTVCDMGSGNGYYTIPIAQLIGDRGQVIAVDVQIEMLTRLRERMTESDVTNITPALGSYHDPHLEDETLDLLLMVDVYHEFSHPELMLRSIRRALKPDGVICLVEYRAEDPKVPIKPLHKMSKAQINKEYTANGFTLIKEFDKLPWQHVMFFGKDDRSPQQIAESLNALGADR